MHGIILLLSLMITLIGAEGRERNGYQMLRKSIQDRLAAASKKNDDTNKLRSAKTLLGDPRLETFKFILPTESGYQQTDGVNTKTVASSRYVAALRYYSGAIPERKVFKVKLSIQGSSQKKYRKLKGTLVFPKNISDVVGECQWDLNTRKGKKIVFVPKACVKMIIDFDKKKMQGHNVIALLIPKRNKLYGTSKRKITKKFVLVSYGKRMGALLRQLALRWEIARLLVTRKRHERQRSKHRY